MSSHVVVISTDLRRATIKVTPSTYLVDVLDDACRVLGLTSSKYLLKHNKKPVDLSSQLRTSRLASGAKLELVLKSNTPSAVSVAIQIPPPEGEKIPGGRIINKFSSETTIWKILRHAESGTPGVSDLNITGRGVPRVQSGVASGSGQLFYESPVLNIMGRELSGLNELGKTLSQLGYNSGSVLIRLAFKPTDQTLFDAMKEISEFFSEGTDEASLSGLSTAPQPVAPSAQSTSSPAKEPVSPEANQPTSIPSQPPVEQAVPEAAQHTQQNPIPTQPTEKAPGSDDPSIPIAVFVAPVSSTPAAALADLNEADYVPTIAHAQIHQARLQQHSRNKRLLSDREKEEQHAAHEAKIASITSIDIKVRFPDNTSATWKVGPNETGATLHKGVRSVMADPSLPFRLVLAGYRTLITDDDGPNNRLIHTYNLAGNVLVNLNWDDAIPPTERKNPFLKESFARQAQGITIPDVPVLDDKPGDNDVQVKIRSTEPNSRGSEAGMGKKIPKWLKMGKK